MLLLSGSALLAQTMVPNPWTVADPVPNSSKEVQSVAVGLDLMGGSSTGVTGFPNEQQDHLIVSVAGGPRDRKSVRMANAAGEHILSLADRTENTFLIDVSRLRKGLYFLEIRSGGAVFRKKWLKQL